jgi:hypothetical protein
MKAVAERFFKASSFIANICFVAAILLRTPDGQQYLTAIAVSLFLTALTCGVAILWSGYYKTTFGEAQRQRDSHGASGSTDDNTSPVSTT